jgi:hypothetical protein
MSFQTDYTPLTVRDFNNFIGELTETVTSNVTSKITKTLKTFLSGMGVPADQGDKEQDDDLRDKMEDDEDGNLGDDEDDEPVVQSRRGRERRSQGRNELLVCHFNHYYLTC